jgi:hypothetical protein
MRYAELWYGTGEGTSRSGSRLPWPERERYMLKLGTAAPDFDAVLETGESFKLSDWAETKNVVIYFFPKAFTKG